MDGNEQSEKQPIPSQPRRLEHELQPTRLTPLESMIIGSSLTVDGVNIGGEEILNKGSRFYLRPFGLPPDAAPEAIASFSKDRKNKFLEGNLVDIFDLDLGLDREGYKHRLWLPQVDAVGTTAPRLKIQLVDGDGKVVVNQEILDRVKPDSDIPSGFKLEPEVNPDTQEKTGDFFLSFEQPDNP